MSFPKYPKYKASGVEWLGDVPEGWAITKLGRVVFMQEGPGLRNWQFTDEGTRVICVTNITEAGIDFARLEKFISTEEYNSSYRHFTVQRGDVLLSSSGNSWGKVAIYEGDEEVILNTSTVRLNQSKEEALLKRDYIALLLQSGTVREQLGLAMTGSCQPNFGPTHLNSVMVTVPPLAEQTVIAAFLDRETAKIDGLVAEQRRLMELLKEKRQAVISHAVTKGLNPHAKMKPSGIEWLGDVPEHWTVKSLSMSTKRIAVGLATSVTQFYRDNGIPIIRNMNIKEGYFDGSDMLYLDESFAESQASKAVYCGDVIVVHTGSNLGLACVVPDTFHNCQTFTTLIVTPHEDLLNHYLVYCINSSYGKMEVDRLKLGFGKDNLNVGEFKCFNTVLPPIDEQRAIVDYLDKGLAKIDTLTAEAQRAIDLLQERRTALISAAVTGQIDVRNININQGV